MPALDTYMADALDRLDDRHQRRVLVPTRVAGTGRLVRDGQELIDFSSNDYLGLAHHPLLAKRSAEWSIRYGSGSGASRLVTGTAPEHLELEARIARFKGTEAALLFPTGWQLNAAVLAALLKAAPGALLFMDRLIHGSLHAGAADHRQIRFRHNDLDHLEELLAKQPDAGGPRLIVTESVFSMDGDRADLERLARIARANDAFLYVDEAHATGVLGPGGAGLSAAVPGAADLVMGTFSKAMGCFGAYVAGSRLLIDYLVNCCGGFIFSTAPPAAMLGAIDDSRARSTWSPSMLNTLSVTIRRGPSATTCAASNSSRWPRSLWRNRIWRWPAAPAWRLPWIKRSVNNRVPGAALSKAANTAALSCQPDGNSKAASVPLNCAIRASIARCSGPVPVTSRDAPLPLPWRIAHPALRSASRGCVARPR